MSLPQVAIVGRPNVGKSSLLNALARKRISIVDDMPGVTRDRVSTVVELVGRRVELIDTGGIGIVDSAKLEDHIESQINYAMSTCNAIVFLVDARTGAHPLDIEVARMLRELDKPFVFVANKAEKDYSDAAIEFYSLGIGEALPLSALERVNLDLLAERIVALLPEAEEEGEVDEDEPQETKIAIVGGRNAGKSTLVNRLFGSERVIVSEVPGTTRDSVDVIFEHKGRQLMVIDTAGVRRRRAIQDSVDFYGQARTERAVRRADVVLLLVDATRKISRLDNLTAAYVTENFKPCVIALNKWDLASEAGTAKFENYIRRRLRGLLFAPISFLSAIDGGNVDATIDLALELAQQAEIRVQTSELNKAVEDAVRARRPRGKKRGNVGKFYYAAQTATKPPTIVMFVNKPGFISPVYRRYIENFLRKRFEYAEIPIKILFRERKSFFEK